MADMEQEGQAEEAFVPQADRPEVRINPNTPISELRVRDLQSILGSSVVKHYVKEHKDLKNEKYEIKHEKWEKLEKHEKWEKHEWKEYKVEKLEVDGVIKPGPDVDPGPLQEGGPVESVLNRVIESVAGLRAQVDQLANQVSQMERRNR